MKKTIIIAGGNGSIGEILVKSLANNYSVIVLDKKIKKKIKNYHQVNLSNYYQNQDRSGGSGGGSAGSYRGSSGSATANTGGGSGGASEGSSGNGGSGIVIIRYPI